MRHYQSINVRLKHTRHKMKLRMSAPAVCTNISITQPEAWELLGTVGSHLQVNNGNGSKRRDFVDWTGLSKV